MADQSELPSTLFGALPNADDTPGWGDGPVLDRWSLFTSPNQREVAIEGVVSGSEEFADGDTIQTSALRSVDADRRFVVTQNSVYRLGWPARGSLKVDADRVWPPVLHVAGCANWYVACGLAKHYTGTHTLSNTVMTELAAATHDDGSWEERRAACRSIADELFRAERKLVAEAWILLAADLRLTQDRKAARTFVSFAAEQVYHHERDLTGDEAFADSGWRLIASMDNNQIEKLPREGVQVDDPVAAAHKIALIAIRTGVGKGDRLDPDGSVLDDVQVDPDGADPELQADQPGVVVLKEIGGVDTTWSGREVKRVVEPILGKRLPLTLVPDVEAARRELATEFPHAHPAIDALLSDLVGARYARFRASILVGPSGCAKSRLARRVAEVSGMYSYRYDAAGASDNAWGGTARRWSTGEPAVPVLALIAAKAANALVLIDELDKAATGGNNGRLWDALLPSIDSETSARLADPFIQAPVDCSHVSYIATANDPLLVPAPLRDRFRILRISLPTIEHLPALCHSIVRDLVRETGVESVWLPNLDPDELWIAQQLWNGGSIRRLQEIVSRIVIRRAERRH